MKKRIWSILLCMTLLFACLPTTALADIGPKPSVQIEFTGAEEGVIYYATLLSKHESTGPASTWDGDLNHGVSPEDPDYQIWKKFVEYQDSDGYYFLQEFWNCTGTDQLRWGYYPPTPFKVLCYFPETDTFAVSGIYERYAFDTYYTIDLSTMTSQDSAAEQSGSQNGGTVTQQTPILEAEKNYDYTWELISLVARVVITILLELTIALIFGYRHKNQLRFLAAINIVTQIILNVLLNIVNYRSGQWSFVFYYVLLELLVLAIEAVLYAIVLPKLSQSVVKVAIDAAAPNEKVPVPGTITKRRAVIYAVVANIASFTIGLWIAHLIPGIF